MKNDILSNCQLTKTELISLLFENYELGDSLKDMIAWSKFQVMDELSQRLVMLKGNGQDEYFGFCLNLNEAEQIALQEYLLKRKSFVVKYLLSRGSYSPYTYLYQFYLQYLSCELNDVEKNVLLDGYIEMLTDFKGDNYATTKRSHLERKLNLR